MKMPINYQKVLLLKEITIPIPLGKCEGRAVINKIRMELWQKR